MKNKLTLLIGTVIALVLVAYMIMFQLRYDEWAVVSTFGSAGGSSVKKDPRLYFKWPPPIQTVKRYSRLVQVLDDEMEEVITKDNQVIVVKTYLAWRIGDPLAFLKELGTIPRANAQLMQMGRNVRGVFSRYNFNEMVNPNAAQVKLQAMEQEATDQLQKLVASESFGIEIERLGIRRIMIPEKVTERVFERMKQERRRLAAEATTSGEAEARRITEQAQQISDQILSFADRFAGAIELEGDREASRYLAVFQADPELANFLRWTENLETMLKHRTTFFLSTDQILSPQHLLGAREHALPGTGKKPR
jgi:membrane protease subunit HflC